MENSNVKNENMEMMRDLIAINHDRIKGYSKAISLLDNVKDSDLVSIFENHSQQAQQFNSQLIPLLYREEDSMDDDEKIKKMHRNWLEMADGSGNDVRETVLVACKNGEKETARIYALALENLEDVEESVREAIRAQAQLQVVALDHLSQVLPDYEK